jgi:hypothetical protein
MRVLVVCVLTLLHGTAGWCGEPRSVTIAIDNQTPDVDVSPSIETFGAPSQLFSKSPSGSYEYRFKVSESEWFNNVDIKIAWKNAYLNNDGTKSDFAQRVSLRLRRDFPDRFVFPVYFANKRSQAELTRLEHEKDIDQQFEVFFRASQIANYYRDTLGAKHALTKRAVKLLFLAAVALAEQKNYFVIMNSDAEQMASESFGDTYANRANLARSVYWSDLKQIDAYAAKGDCARARLLLNAFEALKSSNPAEFSAQYAGNPNVLEAKALIIAKVRCLPRNSVASP